MIGDTKKIRNGNSRSKLNRFYGKNITMNTIFYYFREVIKKAQYHLFSKAKSIISIVKTCYYISLFLENV